MPERGLVKAPLAFAAKLKHGIDRAEMVCCRNIYSSPFAKKCSTINSVRTETKHG